jgi:hypothetical protein
VRGMVLGIGRAWYSRHDSSLYVDRSKWTSSFAAMSFLLGFRRVVFSTIKDPGVALPMPDSDSGPTQGVCGKQKMEMNERYCLSPTWRKVE